MSEHIDYEFDRFLRYDELRAWLDQVAREHPHLVSVETYGRSHEGRDLLLVTITDAACGSHDTKPAHWVDASIHAVELTATVAACYLIHHLVTGHGNGDERVTEALRTRTFYVVPRVNPDGAELVLADRPKFRRSSVRKWPWTDGHRWPGHEIEDIDGDGRILDMRIPDPHGAWMPNPDEPNVMMQVPLAGAPAGTPRYRVLLEGSVHDYDGFTIPLPRASEGLDLNRNFPSGWSTTVTGAGDHPLSEPEIDALVRAITARPNICGYNAFHTAGGVLLRPSSTQPDSALAAVDVWTYGQLGEVGTALTDYQVHSVYEDFTWDKRDLMSGAADDWIYDHLAVLGWTTEFWDAVRAATGERVSTHWWYVGATDEQKLAVYRWIRDVSPESYVDWYEFEHPTLGPVELGGWNSLISWTNPPPSLLRAEVAPHAEFAVTQALASPCLEIVHTTVTALGGDAWRVEAGIANTGWLPTCVSERGRKEHLTLPVTVALEGVGPEAVHGPMRRQCGQLDGRMHARFHDGHDGTPDRVLVAWTVTAPAGAELTITAHHQRAGTVRRAVELGAPSTSPSADAPGR